MLTWTAGILLALYAVALAVMKRGTRGSDAAGNALASAYWTFAVMGWAGLAALTGLGYWLKIPFLLATPLVPIAVPVVYVVLRTLRRGAEGLFSKMPTPELRRVERAAKDGDGVTVRELTKAGLRITDVEVGRSLLRAALKGRYAREVVPALLDAGADPNDPGILAQALLSQTTELKPFLEHGADPNTIHPSGDPILLVALDGGWTHNAIALVNAGADLSRRDREGWTVLMAMATGKRGFGPGNWSGIADLLEKGADPKIPAPDGTTLADLYARAGPYDIHPDRKAAIQKALGL